MAGCLEGKVAIVTGSGRGIGRAEALALAAEGARVVVNDPGGSVEGTGGSHAPADEVVATIQSRGGVAVPNYDSVADYAAASRIVQTALDHFGRLDILVNNAGSFRDMPIWEMNEHDWDSIIAVHLKGAFNTCRHAIPFMRKQRHGRIINTASSQWRNPEAKAAYAAAKGGVVSLTYDLAWELRADGITANGIAPMARTRALEASDAAHHQNAKAGLLTEERLAEVNGRPGPEFVPPMVTYLASDAAASVTGCIFRIGSGKISLYSHPTETRSIFRNWRRDGPWTFEELKDLLPGTVLSEGSRAPYIPVP